MNKEYHRRSTRLPNYDYTRPGAYLVTICTQNRDCILSEISNSKSVLTDLGQQVFASWQWLEKQYPYLKLDEFIIMPNHLHGILVITDNCRGGSRTALIAKRKSLGHIVGAFKTISTKWFNKIQGTPGAKLWQRGFYEHVIRNDKELDRIREYIANNPARWEFDKENKTK